MPFKRKDFEDPKWYLRHDYHCDALNIQLFVPPYNVDKIIDGVEQSYTINISAKDRAHMRQKLTESSEVITYVDGAVSGNPGPGGAGVAFFARKVKNYSATSITDSELEE